MASLVEFVVKIRDLASGSFNRMAGTAQASFNRIEQSMQRLAGRTRSLSMNIRDIDQRLESLRRTREVSLDGRQIRRITREIDELERRKRRLEGGSSSGGGMIGFRSLVAGALATAGIAGLGGVISSGMQKEMNRTQFQVLAGEKPGLKLATDLTNFAQDTIYGNEVFGIGQQMLSFGVKSQGVMPSISRLGDIAGGDKDRLQRLGLVYSQVAAQGRLMGQDLLQFVNAGFNPLQIISEKTGKSMAKLKDEMSQGKISFADVAGAIETATSKGGRFFEMTKKIAATNPGRLLALQGSAQQLIADTGASIVNNIGPLISMAQYLVQYPELIMGIAAALGAYALAANAAAIKQIFLNFVMSLNPVALIILAVIALITIIVHLVKRYDGWGKSMLALWNIIKAFTRNVGLYFKDMWQSMSYGLEMLWLKTKNTFQYIGGMIRNFINAMRLALAFKFGDARKALFADIKTSAMSEIDALEKRRTKQKNQTAVDFATNLVMIKKSYADIGLKKKKAGERSAADIGSFGSLAGMSGAPDSVKDSSSNINSGGVKNLYINVQKFFDTLNIREQPRDKAFDDTEQRIKEMFLRIVNSGSAAIS